jgi:hypothetical protein
VYGQTRRNPKQHHGPGFEIPKVSAEPPVAFPMIVVVVVRAVLFSYQNASSSPLTTLRTVQKGFRVIQLVPVPRVSRDKGSKVSLIDSATSLPSPLLLSHHHFSTEELGISSLGRHRCPLPKIGSFYDEAAVRYSYSYYYW